MTNPSSARFIAYRDAQLAVPLDALSGIPLSDTERETLTWLAGPGSDTVENVVAMIHRAHGAGDSPPA